MTEALAPKKDSNDACLGLAAIKSGWVGINRQLVRLSGKSFFITESNCMQRYEHFGACHALLLLDSDEMSARELEGRNKSNLEQGCGV